ncbi:MAG: FAD-binding oxidoreductase, partial [Pseudomonadota bacterium]
VIRCDQVVNASGPRADVTAQMAGIRVPVEPRKRFTWVFTAEQPLDRDLPLTIDPSGVHFRQDGSAAYMAGGHSDVDPAVAFDDFEMDHSLWQEYIWPVLATRIPQFEAIKVIREWAGHYAYNVFDHNAIMGPHTEVENFIFLNGFSGHGLQQSPAMGRGTAEYLTYGEYRSLDLSPFNYARIPENNPFVEKAVI